MAPRINKKSISEQLVEYYRKQIESGAFKPGDEFPSERMLEGRLGISRKTIGKVISVLAGMGYLFKEQGKTTYVADFGRSVHVTAGGKNFGVFFQTPESVYHPANAPLFLELCNRLRDSGYGMELLFDRSPDCASLLRQIEKRGVAGVFLFPPSADTTRKGGDAFPVPAVLLGGRNVPFDDVSWFAPDTDRALADATRLLADAGRRKIAFLYGKAGWPSDEARCKMFRDTLEAGGLKFDPVLMVPSDYERIRTLSALDAILGHVPDAIIGADDMVSRWVVDELGVRGIRVPQDIAVIGFNDMQMYSLRGDIPLTTFAIPAAEMVEAAINDMYRRLAAPGTPPAGIEVPMPLCRRASA